MPVNEGNRPPPEDRPDEPQSPFNPPLSRRQAIPIIAAGTVGVSAMVGTTGAAVINEVGDFFHVMYLRNLQDRADHFLDNVPSEEDLSAEMFHGDTPIIFTPDQIQNVHIYKVGDSIELENGLHQDHLGNEQPNNAEMLLAEAMTQEGYNWQCTSYALPGAPSGIGPYENGVLSQAQLGNDAIIERIANDDAEVIIKLGLNGDDWRPVAKNLRSLVEDQNLLEHYNDPAYANIFAPKIDSLLGQFDNISQEYKQNLKKIFLRIGLINKKRRAKGKNFVRLWMSEPMSYRKMDALPWAPLNDEHGVPQVFRVSHLPPRLKNGLYRITTTIYETDNSLLRKNWNGSLNGTEITTQSLFGIEPSFYIDPETAHPNKFGQAKEADDFAKRLRIWRNRQLEQVNPQIQYLATAL